jgi:hypothetical protein
MALSAGIAAAQRCAAPPPERAAAARAAAACARAPCRARTGSCAARHARAPRSGRRTGALRVVSLDAAQPFDYEALARRRVDAEKAAADKLLIGARVARCCAARLRTMQRSNPARRLLRVSSRSRCARCVP